MTASLKNRLSKLIVLLMSIISTFSNCKANDSSSTLTVFSINDTTIERYRKLLPKGYYIFTELSAKSALDAKINADAFRQKLNIAESTLDKTSSDLLVRTIERNQYKSESEAKERTISRLNRKLFFAKVLNYVEGAAIVILTIKSSIPP